MTLANRILPLLMFLGWAPAQARHTPNLKMSQGTIAVDHSVAERDFHKLAKISLVDAAQTATTQFVGTVTEVSLEKEHGFLVYDVEITNSSAGKREVLIDAGTGDVLLNF